MSLYRRELVQQATNGNGVASVWRYVPVEINYEAAFDLNQRIDVCYMEEVIEMVNLALGIEVGGEGP